MKRCKITVLRREFFKDLVDEYIAIPNWGPCTLMKEGDVFYTGGLFGGDMPEGLCTTAWDSIGNLCSILAYGGKIAGCDDTHIVCCSDGVRPVIFKLEKAEDDVPARFQGPLTKTN
jgi:uncharacterized repeat protein (TIGR04076 family)